jgi:hypothetical protein
MLKVVLDYGVVFFMLGLPLLLDKDTVLDLSRQK